VNTDGLLLALFTLDGFTQCEWLEKEWHRNCWVLVNKGDGDLLLYDAKRRDDLDWSDRVL